MSSPSDSFSDISPSGNDGDLTQGPSDAGTAWPLDRVRRFIHGRQESMSDSGHPVPAPDIRKNTDAKNKPAEVSERFGKYLSVHGRKARWENEAITNSLAKLNGSKCPSNDKFGILPTLEDLPYDLDYDLDELVQLVAEDSDSDYVKVPVPSQSNDDKEKARENGQSEGTRSVDDSLWTRSPPRSGEQFLAQCNSNAEQKTEEQRKRLLSSFAHDG